MKKRILSILLTLALCMGLAALAPLTAHAATHTAGTIEQLFDAIDDAMSGDTIRLTANITSDALIWFTTPKTITLDLSGKTLNMTAGLLVDGGFKLLLLDPTNGQCNVSELAVNGTGSKAEVTNANYTGSDGCPVTANDGGEAIVYGNATSTQWGIDAFGGGKITVNGTITAAGTYIQFFDQGSETLIAKTAADFVTPTTKTGYQTYSYTEGTVTSTVWVKIPATGGGDTGDYFKLWGKTTTYLKSNFWNWILLIFCFGWIWMAF
ncbi:MAG: hypothetical protein FWF60_07205 [Oscillospiraceae bacterium]|nr:hypothetical protein [Oscillospiraceae bacterium]